MIVTDFLGKKIFVSAVDVVAARSNVDSNIYFIVEGIGAFGRRFVLCSFSDVVSALDCADILQQAIREEEE